MLLTFSLLSLLALQLMVMRGHRSGKLVLGLFAAGLLIGVVALGRWIAPPRYLPDASTSGQAVRLANDIREGLAEPKFGGFFILDGGSYTARGVDDELLEADLSRRLKRPVKVLVLSLPGGNQLERWWVLQEGLALLDDDARDAFLAAPKTLLLEIHAQYDRYPLVQLTRNRHTDRAYAYLHPAVALEAIRSDHGSMEPDRRRQQWLDVMVHAAINAFNVGSATRTVSASSVQPGGGYDPLARTARGYQFKGIESALRGLDTPPDAGHLPLENIKRRRARIGRLVGSGDTRTIYFSVPSTRLFDLQYARAFCESQADWSCVDHAHRGLLRRLNHKRFWYDDGHLQKRGAEIYTRWLSVRLDREVRRLETRG